MSECLWRGIPDAIGLQDIVGGVKRLPIEDHSIRVDLVEFKNEPIIIGARDEFDEVAESVNRSVHSHS